jgi:uncharacterized protein YndB with AHSA1/START domain
MKKHASAFKEIRKTYCINSPVFKVWNALTNSEQIKKYFFGTNASSDWKEGSKIIYKGEWEGKAYEDIGIILKLIPEKLLTINYWSSRAGKSDLPENYSEHSYELEESGNTTNLTLVQEDNFNSQESRNKAWKHWDIVIEGLKKVVTP